jgi:hypothetical protein
MSIVPSDAVPSANPQIGTGSFDPGEASFVNNNGGGSGSADNPPTDSNITAIIQKSDDPDDVLVIYSEYVSDEQFNALQKLGSL